MPLREKPGPCQTSAFVMALRSAVLTCDGYAKCRSCPGALDRKSGTDTNDGDDANLRASGQAWSRFRRTADAVDHIIQPPLDIFSYCRARVGGIPSQYTIEIGECPARI
ncbi:MAG TPA: hypothetical protein VFQ87_15025, partial [Bradyrhizobium sp.]|nr:hypothetical protein [Bradyrhizobium sp.]